VRERLTDLLDAFGLILLGIGLGCEVTGWFAVLMRVEHGLAIAAGGLGLVTTGSVLLAGSWLATRPDRGAEQ
jgi:hypothetical protein